LASRAGLFKQAPKVRLDRLVRDPQRRGDLGTAADLDDGEQDAQLGRCQLVGPRDDLGWGQGFQ
jgi:hypothetical protein